MSKLWFSQFTTTQPLQKIWVYSHSSYWLAIFSKTDSSPVLARVRLQNIETSWKKHNIQGTSCRKAVDFYSSGMSLLYLTNTLYSQRLRRSDNCRPRYCLSADAVVRPTLQVPVVQVIPIHGMINIKVTGPWKNIYMKALG